MIVGTRDSALALRQTEIFAEAMGRVCPEQDLRIKAMRSSGDLDLSSSLEDLQGFGAFVRELDAALLSGEIDVAVNSMKDMPVTLPEGLCVAAVLERADVRDVMLPLDIRELPPGARVGTSSIRRRAQLKALRPDVECVPLRGNIQTRLSKLDSGEYDSIILAKAGLDRLSADRRMHILPPDVFVPAPAQGAIAAVCRSDDRRTRDAVGLADHPATRKEAELERGIMRMIGAGCSSPVGINASLGDGGIRVRAVSFERPEAPVRLDVTLPAEYTEDHLKDVSGRLRGTG